MAKKLYDEEDIRGIARAIRTKNKSQNTYRVDQMEQAVLDIETSKPQQSKTVSPSTSQQTVTADEGYELASVKVNAMPDGALNLEFNTSTGLISANVSTAGYVDSTDDKTQKLTVQAGKTVTPSTSNQTAVAANRWTTGAVTVKGDANLKAENIKTGKSIFGVNGSAPVTKIDGVESNENLNLSETRMTVFLADTPSYYNYAIKPIIFNDAIYWGTAVSIYKYDDTNGYTLVVATPTNNSTKSRIADINGELHLFGDTSSGFNHYILRENVWQKQTAITYLGTTESEFCKYGDWIYIFGGTDYGWSQKVVKYNGTDFVQLSNAPIGMSNTTTVVVHGGLMHVFASAYHYTFDGTTWTKLNDLPTELSQGWAAFVEHDGNIYCVGTRQSNESSKLKYAYVWDGTNMVNTGYRLPYGMYMNVAISYHGKLHSIGDGFSGGLKNHLILLEKAYIKE